LSDQLPSPDGSDGNGNGNGKKVYRDFQDITVRSVYAERRPSQLPDRDIGNPDHFYISEGGHGFKEAAGAPINPRAVSQAHTYYALRDPYTFSMKIRFEEAYRTDPVVRSAINKKAAFVLGKKLETIFDLVDTFVNPAEARSAMNILLSDQEITNAKRVIDRVDRRVNFQANLKAAFIQAKVYGRSVILVEAPEGGLPVKMKILSSKLLGQVKLHDASWELDQIQYNAVGVSDPTNFLNAEDIVYFTNCDYHVTPYTYLYGLSDIEAIAHISETNRILNEEDFKEMNYSMWSGFGLLKMPTIRNTAEIQSFLANFRPGRWTAISQDITAEVHELQKDLQSMLTERNENEKLILRCLAVPAAILGFEDIQNFATLQEVMLAWKESEVEEQRSWINSIVEPQWFDRLLVQILNVEDVDDLKVKIILAFEDIALENLKDKALAVIPLYEAGILPPEKVLEYLGFDDVADQIRLIQSKVDTAKRQVGQAVGEQLQKQPSPAQPTEDIQYPSTSGKGLLTQVETEKTMGPQPGTLGASTRKGGGPFLNLFASAAQE